LAGVRCCSESGQRRNDAKGHKLTCWREREAAFKSERLSDIAVLQRREAIGGARHATNASGEAPNHVGLGVLVGSGRYGLTMLAESAHQISAAVKSALAQAPGRRLRYLFDTYVLDPDRRELRGPAGLVDVDPLVFNLLTYLIRNRDRVVSNDDIMAEVWGGRTVSESVLTTDINAARSAIGDSGDAQRLIKTLPPKGMRFVGVVREDNQPDERPAHLKYGEAELRRDARKCLKGLGWTPQPFFNFVIVEGVAIFTIFDDPFEIYIFSCDEFELIRKFDEFAMIDVGPCKQLLATRYGKMAPDVAAARSLAQLWIEGD
jgi:DNA-binding winged helix-turn-helix (wHTH) protein